MAVHRWYGLQPGAFKEDQRAGVCIFPRAFSGRHESVAIGSSGSTRLNLLFDVGFNKEVGQDAALYWSKKDGDLAGLIDRVDVLEDAVLEEYGQKAKQRIRDAYSWQFIADRYEEIFCGEEK